MTGFVNISLLIVFRDVLIDEVPDLQQCFRRQPVKLPGSEVPDFVGAHGRKQIQLGFNLDRSWSSSRR